MPSPSCQDLGGSGLELTEKICGSELRCLAWPLNSSLELK
jgi:hypothetical protein